MRWLSSITTFEFNLIPGYLLTLTTSLVPVTNPPSTKQNGEMTGDVGRWNEQKTQDTSNNMSWAVGMFFFVLIYYFVTNMYFSYYHYYQHPQQQHNASTTTTPALHSPPFHQGGFFYFVPTKILPIPKQG